MNVIRKWIIRTFRVIRQKEALEMGLSFVRNVYGDEINHLNCRSIWEDSRGRTYRVDSLVYE